MGLTNTSLISIILGIDNLHSVFSASEVMTVRRYIISIIIILLLLAKLKHCTVAIFIAEYQLRPLGQQPRCQS